MILHLISYLTGVVAGWRRPRWLISELVRAFAGFYRIDLTETEFPIEDYRSIDHFFTRRLKQGARAIEPGIVSPADGKLYSVGIVDPCGGNPTILQVKGTFYSVAELLAQEKAGGHGDANYSPGVYATIYLAPHNYHRVHAPCSMKIRHVVHVPGSLWPVNSHSASRIRGLFARNERVIIHFETTENDGTKLHGALIAVGALNVGSIDLSFMSLRTNQHPLLSPSIPREFRLGKAVEIDKGGELLTFHLGSTVVLLLGGEGVAKLNQATGISFESLVRQGQTLWRTV